MQYILKLSIALSVVYLFYWLLLRRLTFHNWNRWYLLLYPMVCFLIPLVDVAGLLYRQGWEQVTVISYIPVITVAGKPDNVVENGVDGWAIILMLVAVGSVVMLLRMAIQYWSLRRMLSSAQLLSDGEVKLFHIDKKIIPFSTRKAIYVNRHLHQEQELREIIRHEFIHIKQRHSLDLWWSELLCILNWYNPFAWLIRKAIRQNLEYIADHQVLQSGLDRKQYQFLLLKVTGNAPFSFTSNFNFSSLKKRIVMMNKNKSANANLMRFLFILPLLVVVLLAFRNVTCTNAKTGPAYMADTIPARSVDVDKEFKKRGIEQITVSDKNHKARVTFKNGTVRTFDLTQAEEKVAFEKEFGDLKPPPPPAPPVAPHPASAAAPVAPATPAAPQQVPLPPAPPSPPPVPAKTGTVAVAGEATVAGSGIVSEEPVARGGTRMNFTGVLTVSKDQPVVQGGDVSRSKTTMTADVIELMPVTASAGTGEVLDENPLLEINNTTSREDLDRFTQLLREKGYSFVVKNVNFDNGLLVSIEGTISYGNYRSSFTGEKFRKMSIHTYKENPGKFMIKVFNGRVSFYS